MARHSSARFVWLGIASALWYPLQQWSPTVGALWPVVNYFAVKYSLELWLLIRTLRRDATAGIRQVKAKRSLMAQISRNATVPLLFTETATKYPDKLLMSSPDSSWTFAETRTFTNRVANHFRSRGLKAGDEVCLLMENRPEFVMIWLGLSKLGVVTALINHNVKGQSLAHCVNAVKTKAIIFSNSLAPSLAAALPAVNDAGSIELYHLDSGDAPAALGSDSLLDRVRLASANEEIHRGAARDPLLYIFTSGTTGLPKAAIVTNTRFMYVAASMFFLCPFSVKDKVYLSLPLYHNSGGVLGPGPCLIYGLSCHIATKFSASNFWSDCKKFDCTIALYIGEMVRYLLAQPARPADDTHGVRLLFGHGARKQLWHEFCQRFKLRELREIYGSTEGNAGLVNIDNEPGAIGFLPTVCRMSRTIGRLTNPMFVIKIDPDSGKPVRDHRGRCVDCGPGEPGELICLITSQPALRFEGYVDRNASKKKLYTDVFRPGENAFATGDIVVYDELGYVFFQDRTGDTFRWKSENVSTNEVESVIAKILNFNDAIVYGVEIEGTEGKAGMVAILIKDDDRGRDRGRDRDHHPNDDHDDNDKHVHNSKQQIDLANLLKEMDERLPSYAVPLFLRLTKQIESTSTLKYKKNKLVEEGFNPRKVNDALFFLNRSKKQYVPLDEALHSEIVSGKVRV